MKIIKNLVFHRKYHSLLF